MTKHYIFPSCSFYFHSSAYNMNRAAVEYEKKMHANNLELGQVMEENMVSMARDIEKLHAELANAEKRARAAAAAAAAASPGNLSAKLVFCCLVMLMIVANLYHE